MFPLATKSFPANASDLTALLNESLRRVFLTAGDPVSIQAQDYPHLAAIRIDLDGAELQANPAPPPTASGVTSPALIVDNLELSGAAIALGPAKVDLQLSARDVQLQQGHDENGDVVLVLQSAAEGTVAVSAAIAEIETAIAAVGRREAARHGVTIEQVQLTAQSTGDRSLEVEGEVRARKLFFSTTVRIAARLDLDGQLNARLSGLACNGEGAVGALACGVLRPHLEKLEGREFSLMALPLGEVRLRDVRLAASDRIAVTAEFGA